MNLQILLILLITFFLQSHFIWPFLMEMVLELIFFLLHSYSVLCLYFFYEYHNSFHLHVFDTKVFCLFFCCTYNTFSEFKHASNFYFLICVSAHILICTLTIMLLVTCMICLICN